jgi:hypothetical protein
MIVDATLGAEVQQSAVNFSGVGDNTVVAGIALTRIKILQLFFVCSQATTIQFKSAATLLSGPLPLTANGSFFMDYIQCPLMCNSGDAFIINSSAGAVGGTIWFIQAS